MDSLSQFALGAAVGTAVMGRKVGPKAALYGGLLATLPDLDVLIPMGGDVADFTYHRSFSHSLLVLGALTPLLAWLLCLLQPSLAEHRRSVRWLVLLVLLTHPLLDAMTVYGTQLLWPLDPTPVGLGSIFIIDPLYTLPLLLGLIGYLYYRHTPHLGLRLNAAGLVLSSCYLGWSAVAQQQVEQIAQAQLAQQGQAYRQLLVQPSPLNTLLWRVLVMTDKGYQEGFYGLLDPTEQFTLRRYPSQPALLTGLEQHWPVQRLDWFSRGFYKVSRQPIEGQIEGQIDGQPDALVITDLRMGIEPNYAFSFQVGEFQHSTGNASPLPDRQLAARYSTDKLPQLWQRIWNAEIAFNAVD